MFDAQKGIGMAKEAIDELEMRNYLELLRQANEEGLLDKEKYHETLLKYIAVYEQS